MAWVVAFGEEFDGEFEALPEPVQDELVASAKLLEAFGPQLGRPKADRRYRMHLDRLAAAKKEAK